MAHVVVQNVAITRQQRTSLLVVVAAFLPYNPARNDIHARPARVFAQPDAQVISRSWQTAPSGAANYVNDVQRATQAKFFAPDDTFIAPWQPRAIITAQYADLINGWDTYGWPQDEPAFSPATRGTANILGSFVPYPYATDIVGRKGNAYWWDTYQEYVKTQQPIPNQLTYTYTNASDVIFFAKQQKVFVPPEEFFKASAPITGNDLFTVPVYNAATDVIFRRPQAKVFDAYVEFAKAQGITGNALKFFPVYNPATDVTRLRGQTKYFEDYQSFTDHTLPPNLNLLGAGGTPTPLPGSFPLPNFVNMGWRQASHLIIQLGLYQTVPPLRVQSNIYPNYTVVGQYPPAGTFVVKNTDVTLTVAVSAHLLGVAFDWIPLF